MLQLVEPVARRVLPQVGHRVSQFAELPKELVFVGALTLPKCAMELPELACGSLELFGLVGFMGLISQLALCVSFPAWSCAAAARARRRDGGAAAIAHANPSPPASWKPAASAPVRCLSPAWSLSSEPRPVAFLGCAVPHSEYSCPVGRAV